MIFDYVQAAEPADPALGPNEVRLPHLVAFGDQAVQDKFNADTARRLREYVCDRGTSAKHGMKKHFQAIAEVTFASDEILSYRLKFDYYCGGPYASKFDSGVTWDLKAGAPLRFFEVFARPDDRRPLLKAALAGRAPAGCDAAKLLRDNDPLEFVLVPGGVELWPDAARVPHACRTRLKMSLAEAKAHLAPASPALKALSAAAGTTPAPSAPAPRR